MKKAQMLQFLFYTILALVLFIPTLLFASKFLALSDKPLDSFNQLSSLIDSTQVLESMPLFMDPDNLIIGFSKDANKVKVTGSDTTINRPPQCPEGKSCICLCKDGVEHSLNLIGDQTIECTKKIICNSFDTINFFEERGVGHLPNNYKIPNEGEKWLNGFFVTNSRSKTLLSMIYSSDLLDSNIPRTLTVYIQRFGNFVNVCLNAEECITDDMIDNQNEEAAIEEFERFEIFYDVCKDNGECGTFDLSLPERYFVYYHHKSFPRPQPPADRFFLINTESKPIEDINSEYAELKVIIDNKDIQFGGNLYTEENKVFDSFIIDEALKLSKKENKIILNFIR